MADYRGFEEYEGLPLIVRQYFSRKEYAWMPQSLKDRVFTDATEPDPDSEDPAEF